MGEVFVLADSAEKNVVKAFKRESGKMDKLPICIQCLSNYDTDAHIFVWGDRIFEKCGIRRDEEGDGGKTLEIRGKRRLSARDGGANYQQS